MPIRTKLEDLIVSVHQCTTKDGVVEIEKLYAQKKKELGANISPMMDIRVRDSIRGKVTDFDNEEFAAKEEAALKKQEAAANKLASKMDEGLFMVSESEFFNHDTIINECSVDAACLMDINARIPTKGHAELAGILEDAADHVGALANLYVRESGMLDIIKKLELFESVAGDSVDVSIKGVMFREVDQLIKRGVSRLFALVSEEKIPEYRRLGQHFLRSGGHRFEIVTVKNKMPSSVVEQMIVKDDFEEFLESVPFSTTESEHIYDTILEQMMENT